MLKHVTTQLTLLLLVMCFHNAFAQPKNRKFGKVENDLVKMKYYDKDSSATSVILYNYCDTYFDMAGDNLKMYYSIHRRIKILSESDIDEFATLEIPYYGYRNSEGVAGLKAMIYNEEGGDVVVTKVAKSQMFNEDIDGRMFMKKVSFPNVKVGSVIEYQYKLSTDDFYAVRTFYFQSSVPTMYSEFRMNNPEGFFYKPVILGEIVRFKTERSNFSSGSFKGNRISYSATDIPPLKEEPYVTAIKNYVCRIDHQLSNISVPGFYKDYTRTWAQLGGGLVKSEGFGEVMESTKGLKEMLATIRSNKPEGQDEILAITEYVRKNIKWNDRRSYISSKTQKEILNKREGNSASLNLLLVGLLREAGYEANPVVISTRKHGITQRMYPLLKQFNHVIVQVEKDEKEMLLDAIGKNYGYDVLPFSDLNGSGYWVGKETSKWISIDASHSSTQQTMVSLTLSPDGTLAGTMNFIDKGYLAAVHRGELKEMEEDTESFFEDRILGKAPEAELTSSEVKNFGEVNEPLKSVCEISTTDFTNVAGDFIYIKPMLSERLEKNPFSVTKRTYPIDFGHAKTESFLLTLTIPEGYKVEELPKSTRAVLPDKSASFSYSVMQNGQTIQISTNTLVKKATFLPGEYDAIRNLFDYIVKKQGEQIVLKKI